MDTIEKNFAQPAVSGTTFVAPQCVRAILSESSLERSFGRDWAGRGAAFGDIDNDGDTDIVVSNLGQKAYLLRNDGGNRNNWIGIQLVGTKSNRDGIGARIKVVSASGLTQYFTVNTAVGYLSASDKRVIAGLGQGLQRQTDRNSMAVRNRAKI